MSAVDKGPSVDSKRLADGERVTQAMKRLSVRGGDSKLSNGVEVAEEFKEEMIPERIAAPSVPGLEASKSYVPGIQ